MDAVFQAILLGDVSMVEQLLKDIPNIDNYSESFQPLHLSCSSNTENGIKITKMLLEHGANPNKLNYRGLPVLDMAMADFSLKRVELLLAHGAKVDFINDHGQTYLHRVVSRIMLINKLRFGVEDLNKLIILLLDHGIDINHRDEDGNLAVELFDGEFPEITQLINSYELQIKEPAC